MAALKFLTSTIDRGKRKYRNFRVSDVSDPSIVTTGLVLHLNSYFLNSYPGTGTTWTDLSPYGNNGTLVNSPIYDTSLGASISLLSTQDQWVTVNMNSSIRPEGGLTQESWFRPTASAGWISFGAQFGTGSDNSYALWYDGNWNCLVRTATAGTDVLSISSASIPLVLNQWIHYASTWDGAAQRLYLNGVQIGTKNTAGTITYDTGNTLLGIGVDWNAGYNSGPQLKTTGRFAVLRLYNRGLSQAEILNNFNAERFRYGI